MSEQACFGSASPLATLVQVPNDPGSAHDLHLSPHALSQQTPWAQKPVAHSIALAQGRPGGFLPHDPLMQTAGEAQSASAVQETLQLESPLHR
jgi:hypothetical protein